MEMTGLPPEAVLSPTPVSEINASPKPKSSHEDPLGDVAVIILSTTFILGRKKPRLRKVN